MKISKEKSNMTGSGTHAPVPPVRGQKLDQLEPTDGL